MAPDRPTCRVTGVALAGVVLLGASARSMPGSTKLPTLPSGIICEAQLRRQLTDWHAQGEMRSVASGAAGVSRHVVSTERVGVWLDLRTYSEGRVHLARVTSERTSEIIWDSSCGTHATEHPSRPLPSDARRAFGDTDLNALLAAAADRSVVIYIWSPHMPLSVDGVSTASIAAKRLDLELIPLADPQSSPSYVAAVARRAGLPAGAERFATAIEFAFRDLFAHAPTLLLIVNGRPVDPPLRGYRDARSYERALLELFRQKGLHQR